MRVLMAIAALAAWLEFGGAVAFADSLPISVSADAINGRTHSKLERGPDGDFWSMEWYWDDQGRVLMLFLAKAMRPATGAVDDLTNGLFHGGTDIRREGDGRLKIWNGEAHWLLESELATKASLFADDAVRAKAPHGPERNFCVSFFWISDSRHRVMEGVYCKVLPVGETTTAEALLTALDLQFQ